MWVGSTQRAGSDPRSAQAFAEVSPPSQNVLFHFPPAQSAASVPALSQGASNVLFLLVLPQVLP